MTVDSTAITRTAEKCRDSVAICNVSCCLKTPFDLVVFYYFWTPNCHFEISKGWRQSPRTLKTKLDLDLWWKHVISGIISFGVENSGEFASRNKLSYSFSTLNCHFEISKGRRQSPRTFETKLDPDICWRHLCSGRISFGIEISGEFAVKIINS